MGSYKKADVGVLMKNLLLNQAQTQPFHTKKLPYFTPNPKKDDRINLKRQRKLNDDRRLRH